MIHQPATQSSLPTIVVTGATGNTGTEVVKQLSVVKDVKVRAAVHSLEKAKKLPERVEVVRMEYAEPETILSAFTGATKLFLLPPGDQYDRAETTQMMLEAARKAGIHYIVLISAISIDREPILASDLHLYTKVEEIVAASGIKYTILRPSWFNQNFTSRVFGPQLHQGIVRLPVGDGKTGWIDCRDIAAVAVKAFTEMGHEYKTYNLTGPEALSMHEVVAILSRVSGREIKFMDISEESYAHMLRDFGVPEWFVHKMIEITRKWRIGSHDDVTQDVEKVTGNKPISFEQFAIDHVELLREADSNRHKVLAV